MTEEQAIEQLERALDRWCRGRAIRVCMPSDCRDMTRRLMDLDEAIVVASRFDGSPAAKAAVDKAHKAMLAGGGEVA